MANLNYALVFLVLLSITSFCSTKADFNELEARESLKPTVSVYFESQCPGSKFFFRKILSQHMEDMDFRKVTMDFVPFGFAQHKVLPDGKIEFTCQHGNAECHGNKLLGCAVHVLTPEKSPVKRPVDDGFPSHLKAQRPRGQNVLLQYMVCVMSAADPPKAGEKCAEEVGVSWIEINKCLYSATGEEIMLANEARTYAREPPVSQLPWIEFDGVHYERSYPHFIETFRAHMSARPGLNTNETQPTKAGWHGMA